jgi:hypothetical protein
MAGMPAMQEQLQAMAMERMAPMPCGFHSMDGRYAGNAGAIAGDGHT